MTVDDGGWTSVFTSDSDPCSDRRPRPRDPSGLYDYYTTCTRDNMRYSTATIALRADQGWVGQRGPVDREVLIGFVEQTGAVGMLSRATFLIPAEWVEAAPMSYLRAHVNVSASVNGAAHAVHTLVFGSSYFERDCDYKYLDNGPRGFQEDVPTSIGGNPAGYHGYRGQICLMTADSPWWSNFSTGSMVAPPRSEPEPGYCKSGLTGGAPRRGFAGSETVQQCSATRRFAIFVREVECGSQTADLCKALNRHPCFSTARTCGRCLTGFVGPAPHAAAADRGAWDDNSPSLTSPLATVGALAVQHTRAPFDGGNDKTQELLLQHPEECADAQEMRRLKEEVNRLRRELLDATTRRDDQ